MTRRCPCCGARGLLRYRWVVGALFRRRAPEYRCRACFAVVGFVS